MLGWTINHDNLRELREEARLGPRQAAELVGCHPNTWHNLERGQQPSARLTWRIVNAFSEKLGRTITVADVATPELGWTINPGSLRKLREEAQLTPGELAELAGCHPATYRNLERGWQPGEQLAWNIVDSLSQRLGRKVTVADIAAKSAAGSAA